MAGQSSSRRGPVREPLAPRLCLFSPRPKQPSAPREAELQAPRLLLGSSKADPHVPSAAPCPSPAVVRALSPLASAACRQVQRTAPGGSLRPLGPSLHPLFLSWCQDGAPGHPQHPRGEGAAPPPAPAALPPRFLAFPALIEKWFPPLRGDLAPLLQGLAGLGPLSPRAASPPFPAGSRAVAPCQRRVPVPAAPGSCYIYTEPF